MFDLVVGLLHKKNTMKTKITCLAILLFASCFVLNGALAVTSPLPATIHLNEEVLLKKQTAKTTQVNENKFSNCWINYKEYVTCPDGAQMISTMIDVSWECETGNYLNVSGYSFSYNETCEEHMWQP
jgi:hypothetical protein